MLFGIARWVTFASLLLLVGGGVFVAYVWSHAAREGIASPEVVDRFATRWRGMMRGAVVAAVIGTLASLVLQTAIVADVPLLRALDPSLLAEVATTRFGLVLLGRLGLLALVIVLWLALGSTTRMRISQGRTDTNGWLGPVAGVLGFALLATAGLSGHAGATSPVALNLAADTFHLVAGACWARRTDHDGRGGLPGHGGCPPLDERAQVLAPAVSRFSDMAVVAVGVLVVSGLIRSWVEVGAFHALTGTT